MNRQLFSIATALLFLGLVCLEQSRAQLTLRGVGGGFGAAGGGPVTIDVCGTEAHSGGVTSFDFTGLTISAGLTNSALVVTLAVQSQASSGFSLTWDNGGTNQAMTQITTANTTGASGRSDLWGLINPIAGNKTLHVAWTGATQVFVDGCSWSGVNQTFGTAFTAATPVQATSTTVSATVTSATNHAVMASFAAAAISWSLVNNTQIFIDNTGGVITAAANRAAGAASVTMTGTVGASDNLVVVATDISF